MSAFYNERDPYAAEWLRNLIAAGHIAPGVVDERDIRDIKPDELRGFTQCHFFAGIGVWSHALRRAGWSDDRPVWTGSCPCQPFSAAGQRKGIADERHLWPHWFHLIGQCRPAIVLGEQVASKDGLGWLDLVSTDLEGAGYAFAASDLCAAGFGGAHIRQRLYFAGVADAAMPRRDGAVAGAEGEARDQARVRLSGTVERASGLADPDSNGYDEGITGNAGSEEGARREYGNVDDRRSEPSGLADTDDTRPQGWGRVSECASERAAGPGGVAGRPHAPLLGRDPADWLCCRDGKWRPVEPGTFPLADAPAARVGRLRAYGNALDAETATQFCGAVIDLVVRRA